MAAKKKKTGKKKKAKRPARRKAPRKKKTAGREPALLDLITVQNPETEQDEEVTIARAIINLVEHGMSPHAAGLSIVPERTLYRWLARGEKVAAEGPENVAHAEAPYWQFWQGVQQARAHGRGYLEVLVRKGAKKDPRVALEALGRLYPREWGKRIDHRHAVRLEDLGAIIDKVAAVVLKHVASPEARAAIADELIKFVPIDHKEISEEPLDAVPVGGLLGDGNDL